MTTPPTLAGRMKRYEHQTRFELPKRTYTLLRVDGKAFHTWTKGLKRPFDEDFTAGMNATAVELARCVSGAKFAYVQSDEISLLVTDFADHGTEPWMGGVLQKVVSLSASIATAAFNREAVAHDRPPAAFDSRVWTIADPNEVMNYFIWRQRDCVKNSITMAASTVCSHRELNGLNSDQRQELMWKRGINWNEYPEGWKRGRVSVRETYWVDGQDGKVERSRWVTRPAEHFSAQAGGWLVAHIPRMPELPADVL